MSRVYFHSPSGTAELLGAERAQAGLTAQRIAHGAVDAFHNHERLRELINPAHGMAGRDTSGEVITWAFWFEQSVAIDSGTQPLLTFQAADRRVLAPAQHGDRRRERPGEAPGPHPQPMRALRLRRGL